MPWYLITVSGKPYYIEAEVGSLALSQLSTQLGKMLKIGADVAMKTVAVPPAGGATPTPTPTTTPTPTPTPTPKFTPLPPYTSTTTGTTKTTTIPTEVDLSRASVAGELPPPTGLERFTPVTPTGVTDKQTQEYNDYLAWQKDNPFMPIPKSLNDYTLHYKTWLNNMSLYQAGYTQPQIDSYDAFQAYSSKYGNLNDWMPKNLTDYLENYDQAQQQLSLWKTEAGPEATGFTDAQIREFNAFKDYASQYGKPGEWFPVDIGDFFANYNQAKTQLTTWQKQAGAVEKYELTPEEAVRRREEGYAEEQYAEKERYGEAPMLQEKFASWIGGQGGVSEALRGFIEQQYPSLRAEYEAGLPRLTGFPTREAARAEATKRESGFTAWLSKETPGMEQEYYMQRPYARGERLSEYSPTLKAVNW